MEEENDRENSRRSIERMNECMIVGKNERLDKERYRYYIYVESGHLSYH